MRYQLPADIPVTWSSSAELRVGGSHTGRIFPDHPAVHAMLASLKLGTDEAFLRVLASSHGLDRARVDGVVRGLIGISVPVIAPDVGRHRVLVRTSADSIHFAQLIAREFSRRHHDVALVGGDHQRHLDVTHLVVEVADFVIPTRRYLPLLSADVPHLAVIRDVNGVQLGPLVIPGDTPCLRCEDLAKLADHPEWPAVATQLASSPPPTLPPEVEWLAALQVGLLGAAFLRPGDAPPLGFTRQFVRASTGETTLSPSSFHAGCGCRVPQDSETGPLPREDTTAADAVAHA